MNRVLREQSLILVTSCHLTLMLILICPLSRKMDRWNIIRHNIEILTLLLPQSDIILHILNWWRCTNYLINWNWLSHFIVLSVFFLNSFIALGAVYNVADLRSDYAVQVWVFVSWLEIFNAMLPARKIHKSVYL